MPLKYFDRKLEEEALECWESIHKSYKIGKLAKIWHSLLLFILKIYTFIVQTDLSGISVRASLDRTRLTRYYFVNYQKKISIYNVIFLLLLVFSTLGSLIICYIQIMFNWYRISTKRLEEKMKSGSFQLNGTFSELEFKFNKYKNLVNYVGYPPIEVLLFLDLHILWFINLGVVCYAGFHLFNRFSSYYDCSCLGILTNRKLYLHYYVRVVVDELNACLHSQDNFIVNILREGSATEEEERGNLISIYRSHNDTFQRLKSMLLTGEFMPYHRRPDWCQVTSVSLLFYGLFYIFNAALTVILICVHLAPLFTKTFERIDLVTYVTFLAMTICACVSAIYIYSVSFFATVGLIHYTNQLNKKINNCIIANHLKLNRRRQQPERLLAEIEPHHKLSLFDYKQFDERANVHKRPEVALIAELNEDFLYLIIQYKLFLRMFEQTKKTLHNCGSCLIQTFLFFFSLISFGAEFFTRKECLNANLVSLCFICIVSDVFFLPICHLNAQTGKLYKNMLNLAGNTVEVEKDLLENRGNFRSPGEIFDEHLLLLLRNELDLSAKKSPTEVVEVLSTACTYQIVFRCHLIIFLLVSFGFVISWRKDPYHNENIGSIINRLALF